MKLALIISLLEAGATKGYNTSEKNREHYDDWNEWQTEVRRSGGDTFKKTATGQCPRW